MKNCVTNTYGVKGFKELNLINGNTNKEYSLYVFHSEWNSKDDFTNWSKSDSFRLAHKDLISRSTRF